MEIAFLVLFCNKAEQTVEGLKNWQRYRKPIYLLNNGSDEEGTAFVEKYIKDKKSIKYFKVDENLGVSAGRNYLVKKSTEEWLFFLDNDITIDGPFAEVLKKYHEKNEDADAFIPRIVNVHMNNQKEKFYNFEILDKLKKGNVGFKMLDKGVINKVSGGASLINRKVFDEVGLYDEDMFVGFEDYELSLRAIKEGRELKCVCIPEIELLHDHRQVVREEDNQYLKVRYDTSKIAHSYNHIQKKLGYNLPNGGLEWSRRKIKEMSKEIEPVNEKKRPKVVLYAYKLHSIGGVETYCEMFCKRMAKWYDLIFACSFAEGEILSRISKHCEVVVDDFESIGEVDVCIAVQAWSKKRIPIQARRYIQGVHGDYEVLKNDGFQYRLLADGVEHVACCPTTAKSFEKATDYECGYAYNLLDDELKAVKPLVFITVSRLVPRKGWGEMVKLCQKLRAEDVHFLWLVFGDSDLPNAKKLIYKKFRDYPEVRFLGAGYPLTNWYALADWNVLFSETEGLPYAIYEGLQMETPALVSNYLSAGDLVDDGVNGWIIKDVEGFDIEKIKKPLKFVFKEKEGGEQQWIDIIGKTYKKKPSYNAVELVVLTTFKDTVTNILRKTGERFVVSKDRADEILAHPDNLVRRLCSV